MRFDLKALPPDDYAKWIADAKASADGPRPRPLRRTRQAEHEREPQRLSLGRARLFESIVNGTAPQPSASIRRRLQARRGDLRGNLMLGKLTWVGDPVQPADPARHLDRGDRRHPVGARPGHGQGLVALSVARVDHLGRPQAHRRHVLPARAGDARPRLRRRDHDAHAAGVRLPLRRLPAVPSITTRSSPPTARS